ncbi:MULTISPECIES: hypothetical protein [unclassified Pseudomonas]|uniref:hypothetical protein n=1 Tax=unclassified Pseudomonas TaxID=196821 RepID=UPI000A0DF311|nr:MULTISPECIES: hypothetical protein [unclassified Pseudomonas]SMF47624.1 hypothetical protein SAMN02745962_04057 [Pseudomonas sp. LAIL14HWK12:I11]SMR73767.1 hypothetical protein SAMN05661028_01490 [Pseudomonas sp. LAIL14HWK12:I10]SOD06071.1 hypothetical protein SAMN05660296_04122 [Pseudomonas sp. LAIL14HWK12:I8]
MKFTASQQHEFDTLIGQAAEASQGGRHARALEHLEAARISLVSLDIQDDYDWSGWYDLKMEVLMAQGLGEQTALTARQMLEQVNPKPSDFTEAHHRIIQDSLISAARVLSKYLFAQDRTGCNEEELRRTLKAGISMAYRQEREEALQELQQLHSKAFAIPYELPDEMDWEDAQNDAEGQGNER